jgi:hypothetical protein
MSVADKPLIGKKIKETKDGVEVVTGDNVDRARLKVDTRKWFLSIPHYTCVYFTRAPVKQG